MKNWLVIVFSLFIVTSMAQEQLSGISSNPVLINNTDLSIKKSKSVSDTLVLPFLDDFSSNTIFPNQQLWIDHDAFIDYTYDVYPVTVGVATLDALNEKGKVYDTASAFPTILDHLTSLPIDLSKQKPADSVYLSFYYQPGGGTGSPWQVKGNAPETEDSLLLEFSLFPPDSTIILADTFYWYKKIMGIDTISFSLDSVIHYGDTVYLPFDTTYVLADTIINQQWKTIWAVPGLTLSQLYSNDSVYFKQVMIPLTESTYFYKGFQFRFSNYASLYDNEQPGWKAGNIDQWHLDYIYLNKGRTKLDTTYEDVAFTKVQGSMLNDYSSVPWSHFRNIKDPLKYIRDTINLFTRYLGKNSSSSTNVNYVVHDRAEVTPDFILFGAEGRTFNSIQDEYLFKDFCNFDFKTTDDDSAAFDITGIIKYNLPFNKQNDTVNYIQRFSNYYAYDDGTPENGYGFKGENVKIAQKFSFLKSDTLRAVQLFFNHTLNEENAEPFTLMIWNDNNGQPGSVAYSAEEIIPEFEDSLNQFHTYKIDDALLVLNGTYYFGWLQESDIFMNIGFDKSVNKQNDIFYNQGAGWQNTYYEGTLMIRPVFGSQLPLAVHEPSTQEFDFTIYPNPARDQLTIENSKLKIGNSNISISNILGEIIYQKSLSIINCQLSINIDVNQFEPGIYFIHLTDDAGNRATKKLIISNR